jgi:hypothetical protein
MEETVGPVSTCGRELLRGWWRPIGLMVSFMIFYSVSPGYFGYHQVHMEQQSNVLNSRAPEQCHNCP